jgi:hypothetical protein
MDIHLVIIFTKKKKQTENRLAFYHQVEILSFLLIVSNFLPSSFLSFLKRRLMLVREYRHHVKP